MQVTVGFLVVGFIEGTLVLGAIEGAIVGGVVGIGACVGKWVGCLVGIEVGKLVGELLDVGFNIVGGYEREGGWMLVWENGYTGQ